MSRIYSSEEQKEMILALNVQSACNLSGVLHWWARAASVVREALGTNYGPEFNTHPVNILYMSKVASLLGVAADSLGGVEGKLPPSAGKEGYSNLSYWAFGEAQQLITKKPKKKKKANQQ